MGDCYLVDNVEIFQKPKQKQSNFLKTEQPIKFNETQSLAFLIPLNDLSNENKIKSSNDSNPEELDQKKNCILMKRSENRFQLPMVKNMVKLKNFLKKNEFRIELKNGEINDAKNDVQKSDEKDENEKKIFLKIDTINFKPNEIIFPVEKQYNIFELVGTNKQFKTDFIIDEQDSTNTSIRTLNDCYLHCLNNNVDDFICHSFTFCFDEMSSIAKCQLSYLYFDDFIESGQDSKRSDDFQVVHGKFSKYLKQASDCKVYNLLFKNYFKEIDSRTIGDTYASFVHEDYTLEECIQQCYFQTKNNRTVEDTNNACRLVEFCVTDEKINENELTKKSYCRMSNYEARELPRRKKRKNCRIFDCKYQNRIEREN